MTTATDDTRLGIMEGRLTEQSIAIQELRNDFREGQQQMNARLDEFRAEVNTRFGEINTRFGEINTRFGEVNTRFGEINTRFGEVSARFDEVNAQFDEIRAEVNDRFEQMNNRIHQLTLAVIGVGGTVAVAMLSFAGVLAFQLIQNG